LVIPLIQRIVGVNVRVIDPAPAVAKQARRLLEARGLRKESRSRGDIKFYTSGDPDALRSILPLLMGESGKVEGVDWSADHVVARSGAVG
jgi:glutamate racemase